MKGRGGPAVIASPAIEATVGMIMIPTMMPPASPLKTDTSSPNTFFRISGVKYVSAK